MLSSWLCIFRYLFLLPMSSVQIQFIYFFFLHFAFLLHKNQQSSQFWEQLQNRTLSLLQRLSDKQGKHSKCDGMGAVESSPGSGCSWCWCHGVSLLIGTLVLFLLDQWEWSVKRAEMSLSWPGVKEMALLRCINTDGLGVVSGLLLARCRN